MLYFQSLVTKPDLSILTIDNNQTGIILQVPRNLGG